MAIGIVSLIADGRIRLKVYCGSAACLSRAVDKRYLSVKQSSFQWLKLKNSWSGRSRPVVIRPRHCEIRINGKMQTNLRILLV